MPVVNTYCPGVPDLDQTKASFMAVLTQSEYGHYKVYTGLVKLPSPEAEGYDEARKRAAIKVAGLGRPVNHQEARCYFPTLLAQHYRN